MLPPLAIDAVVFCACEVLMEAGRNRVAPGTQNPQKWLQNLAEFVGAILGAYPLWADARPLVLNVLSRISLN